jgi:hypothetical protein
MTRPVPQRWRDQESIVKCLGYGMIAFLLWVAIMAISRWINPISLTIWAVIAVIDLVLLILVVVQHKRSV